jgi:cytochrome c oxidase subunit 2
MTVLPGHFLLAASPSILDGAGDEARRVAGLWWFMLAVATIVYVVVAGLVAFAVVRHQRPSTEVSAGEPGEGAAIERRGADREEDIGFIWWGGIVMPIAVLGVLAFLTVTTSVALRRNTPDALRVDVVAHQWWWDVTYPDGAVRTANEIHVPVGRTVDIQLRSVDVIHSFWVPQLAGKLDVIPGQTNVLTLRARRTGTFLGECAEFCGVEHANMRFVVVVQSADDYAAWSAGERSPPEPTDLAGEALFQRSTCSACHTVRGTAATGTVGPDLSDIGSRAWIGAHTVANTPDNLRRWIDDPSTLKPGVLMPPSRLSPAEVDELVAYLEALR